ncbi:MAG: hypothetical protein V1874_07720 [Spirochaetota bacterium]
MEKVIPELVYTDSKGYKTMSYDRLTAVLVEAVKELKAQSDAKISALSKENAELKQRKGLRRWMLPLQTDFLSWKKRWRSKSWRRNKDPLGRFAAIPLLRL